MTALSCLNSLSQFDTKPGLFALHSQVGQQCLEDRNNALVCHAPNVPGQMRRILWSMVAPIAPERLMKKISDSGIDLRKPELDPVIRVYRTVRSTWLRCTPIDGDVAIGINGTGKVGVCSFHSFYFTTNKKQWGGPRPKSGGRLLDGRTWDQFPEAPA